MGMAVEWICASQKEKIQTATLPGSLQQWATFLLMESLPFTHLSHLNLFRSHGTPPRGGPSSAAGQTPPCSVHGVPPLRSRAWSSPLRSAVESTHDVRAEELLCSSHSLGALCTVACDYASHRDENSAWAHTETEQAVGVELSWA